MLATLSSVVAQLVGGHYEKANGTVSPVLNIVLGLGLGIYQANIIQFGLDQLSDASTTQIQSFIIWYVWTFVYSSSGGAMDFIFACFGEKYSTLLLSLFICTNLSLALVLFLLCNNRLVKEPATQNPFKLLYKVIRYAIKNKQPRQRSAFTYCEDELPSRIDFGKSKFGGPFTTEQVEDVKTGLRIIPMVIFGGAFAGGKIMVTYIRTQLLSLLSGFESVHTTLMKEPVKECYTEASYTHTLYYSGLIFIILHELFIYPICYRCCDKITSLHKVIMGMVIEILRVFTLMAYNVILRQTISPNNGTNTTIIHECLFQASQESIKAQFSPKWIALPDFLGCVSLMLLCIGVVEFLSSQVPYSMK